MMEALPRSQEPIYKTLGEKSLECLRALLFVGERGISIAWKGGTTLGELSRDALMNTQTPPSPSRRLLKRSASALVTLFLLGAINATSGKRRTDTPGQEAACSASFSSRRHDCVSCTRSEMCDVGSQIPVVVSLELPRFRGQCSA